MNTQEPPEVRLGTFSLNLWFTGQVISYFLPPSVAAGPGEWMTSIAAVAMVIAGIARTTTNWHQLPYGLQQFVTAGMLILVPMTLMGIFKGLDDPLYTALQAVPWFGAIFLPALGVPRLPRSILTSFRWHAFIGVLITAWVVSRNWGVLSSEFIRRDETLGIKGVQFLLYSLFFQVFMIGRESLLHRLIALLGITLMLIIAFGSGTRQPIFLLSLVIAMAVWSTVRSESSQLMSATRKLVTLVSVLAIMAAVVFYIFSNLRGAVDLLSKRMNSEHEGTSLRENSRISEAKELVDQFRPIDYVFGRGIRGQFDNTAAPKQDNAHIGWFRTLLKGGLPMVLLLFIGYFLAGVRAAWSSRNDVMLAAALVVAYFGIKNATGNIILANGHFYIVAICVGAVYSELGRLAGPRRP